MYAYIHDSSHHFFLTNIVEFQIFITRDSDVSAVIKIKYVTDTGRVYTGVETARIGEKDYKSNEDIEKFIDGIKNEMIDYFEQSGSGSKVYMNNEFDEISVAVNECNEVQ
jgi:S-adenosylmethionine hydrolase